MEGGGEAIAGARPLIPATIPTFSREEREHPARGEVKRLRDMRGIAERCARLLGPGPSAVEHGEVLYDDRGLPS